MAEFAQYEQQYSETRALEELNDDLDLDEDMMLISDQINLFNQQETIAQE